MSIGPFRYQFRMNVPKNKKKNYIALKSNLKYEKSCFTMKSSAIQLMPGITGTLDTDRTSGGIRVVTDSVSHVESVTIGAWINAGSREDPENRSGLAHFVEHAVFKGAGSRDYLSIARCMEDVGGYIDAWTTKENTCICIRCLKPHIELAFSLLSDLVCRPGFPAGEIEKEKEVVIEEIQSVNDSPEEMVFEEFDRLSFGHHPLGHAILGTEESVLAITADDLRTFMHSNYTPENIVISAAGCTVHEEIMRLTEHHFSGFDTSFSPLRKTRNFAMAGYHPFNVHSVQPIYQTQVVSGSITERDNSDFYSLLLLNTVLGGGMSSRFNLELREKHPLAYNAYTSLTLYDDVSMFNVYAGTDNRNASRALDIISAVLAEPAATMISPEELETAKTKLAGAMIMGMEKMSRRMSRNARDLIYFDRVIPLEEKIHSLEAVTPEDMNRTVARMFHAHQPSYLVFEAEEDDE